MSSIIKNFSYEKESQKLTVELTTGRTYVYQTVPAQVAIDFENATSKGQYFNKFVKSYPVAV